MAAEVESNVNAKVALERLNEQYIQAFLASDVAWFAEHLADEFTFISAAGVLQSKSEFLEVAARTPDIKDYRLRDVHVRCYGQTALVQAVGLFTRPDGSPGISRYTDMYVETPQGWRVVSAQVSRRARFL